MRCAVTGSFDPITIGHIDIIKASAKLFDEVYVVVLNNEEKSYMFDMREREDITRYALEGIPNVKVMSYEGYVIDFCHEHDIKVVVRGFRNEKDYEYETIMSKWNKEHGGVETLLMPQDKESHMEISSTLARANINDNAELSKYLTDRTIEKIKEITNNGK